MKQETITCNVCGRYITISDEKEHMPILSVLGERNIIISNFPSFITVNLKSYGNRYNLNREYDICEECLWNGIIIDQVDKHLRLYSRKELARNER